MALLSGEDEAGRIRTEYLGQPAVRLENGSWIALVVPGWGGRVVSLRNKEAREIELLRVPPSLEAYEASPLLYGIPVLFPPNRIENGTFVFGERTYRLAINDPSTGSHSHGFVHDKEWTVLQVESRAGTVSLTMEFDSFLHPQVMEQFPHRFLLKMKLTLEESRVTQTMEVHNASWAAFPWGLGYHTAFRFPFGDSASLRSCELQAPVGRSWKLDERFLPTGELAENALGESLRGGMPMEGVLLDDVFESYAGAANEAVLTDREAGLRLRYRADEAFGHWVFHNGDGRGGFLCPEPYSCVTNAFNSPLDPSVTGMKVLEPGESFSLTCSIEVERL
ncbi:aldose 1-epimerase [Cohnella thailandensis]|uniref:Aldose 1-epimerase n=1 Tax=Cohnella thailandensis TaxID=557557 RepID=A0A841T2A6_9BACL|nr:aldose 1-epimerase [Cohnella thailandensis]MBB6637722.1 aldose 1-epimerase [Cohnella thailandensis]MBP1974101.1 aldose 1-epimerase [Cohnella thailandensis]